MFNVADLRALPAELAAEVLRQAAFRVQPSRRPRRGVVHRALRRRPRRGVRDRGARSGWGALRMERSGRWLRVGPLALPPLAGARWDVPGALALDELGLRLEARFVSRAPDYRPPRDARRVAFDADALPVALHRARPPAPATASRHSAGPGTRRLKSFLIDAGVPRWERARIPLFEAGGEIVWVVGLRRGRMAPGPRRRRRILEVTCPSPLAVPESASKMRAGGQLMISRAAAILARGSSRSSRALALADAAAPRRAPRAGPVRGLEGVLQALEDAFASVADRVTPAVVNVSTKAAKRAAAARAGGDPPESEQRFREFFGPEFFERFFRRRPPRDEGRARGSGVIVDARGFILTNNHVVENAGEIEVRLSDDRKFPATLVGRDPKTDLAVLKIDAAAASLPVAELGDSDKLRIGQWAIAIGNPFGLDRTVTAGIISATGRTRVGVATYEAFIQTDASINPGNSGGPLLEPGRPRDRHQYRHRVDGPGHRLLDPDQHGHRHHGASSWPAGGSCAAGWASPSRTSPTELAAGFGVKPGSGVLVSDVMKDSPAEAAGSSPATSSWSSAARRSRTSPTCRSGWPRWSRAGPAP